MAKVFRVFPGKKIEWSNKRKKKTKKKQKTLVRKKRKGEFFGWKMRAISASGLKLQLDLFL